MCFLPSPSLLPFNKHDYCQKKESVHIWQRREGGERSFSSSLRGLAPIIGLSRFFLTSTASFPFSMRHWIRVVATATCDAKGVCPHFLTMKWRAIRRPDRASSIVLFHIKRPRPSPRPIAVTVHAYVTEHWSRNLCIVPSSLPSLVTTKSLF